MQLQQSEIFEIQEQLANRFLMEKVFEERSEFYIWQGDEN